MRKLATGIVVQTDPCIIEIVGHGGQEVSLNFDDPDDYDFDIGDRIHAIGEWRNPHEIDTVEVLQGDTESLHDLLDSAVYMSTALTAARLMLEAAITCAMPPFETSRLITDAYRRINNSFHESDAGPHLYRAHIAMKQGEMRNAMRHMYDAETAMNLYVQLKTCRCIQSGCNDVAPKNIRRCKYHFMSDDAAGAELNAILGLSDPDGLHEPRANRRR